MNPATPEQQLALLATGAVDLVRREELLDKLRRGRPLRVKAGFDPSAPDIHLGHVVVLRKMKQFQELGHEVVFVVGDFTARIGDPSGRSKTRPALSVEEVRRNADTYRAQAVKILDPARTRLEYNSTWLEPLGAEGWMRLAGKMTVARMLERDDFAKRFKGGIAISIHEFLYPLAQAYDSVALDADVELGGTDQTFNLLVGRDIMREYGLEPQVILTTPLLVGLDGAEKMSKSLGNYIGIDEPPGEMYGKIMSITDELMWLYYERLTDLGAEAVRDLRRRAELGELHPMRLKEDLGATVVQSIHGQAAAEAAREGFTQTFRRRETPEDVEEREIPSGAPLRLARLLCDLGLAPSGSEARRLLQAGGVRVNGEKLADPAAELPATPGTVYDLKVGKHRFVRLRLR